MANSLLHKDANLTVRDNEGNNALLWTAVIDNKMIVEKVLIEGSDIESKNIYSRTALLVATAGSQRNGEIFAIQTYRYTRILDIHGSTTVSLLVTFGNILEITNLLLSNGTKMEIADKRSKTPLMNAADNGNVNLINLLLSKGANIPAVDKDLYSPIFWAVFFVKGRHYEQHKI